MVESPFPPPCPLLAFRQESEECDKSVVNLSKDQGLWAGLPGSSGVYQAAFVPLDLGHSKLVVVGRH